MSAVYARNIHGVSVKLQFVVVDPDKVKLFGGNPRTRFSMKQLGPSERSEAASALILTSQEDTEGLKRSIILSEGIQEPVYLLHDYTVVEGNRRVVAMRAAKEEQPKNLRFRQMPAWVIPKGTSEATISDLINEIHLGSVRGWAPYEKALQMQALVKTGLIEEEIAERYRMTSNEVRQHIAAAEMMDKQYFPITNNQRDPEHRSKFSYFLEFKKNGRIRKQCESARELPAIFSKWIRDDKIKTGASVRKLPKILDSSEAVRLLDVDGFAAAEEYIAKKNPREQELYLVLERARARLHDMPVTEITEMANSTERVAILRGLQEQIATTLENAGRLVATPARKFNPSKKTTHSRTRIKVRRRA